MQLPTSFTLLMCQAVGRVSKHLLARAQNLVEGSEANNTSACVLCREGHGTATEKQKGGGQNLNLVLFLTQFKFIYYLGSGPRFEK